MAKHSEKQRKGCIYAIGCNERFVKIGLTTGTAEERLFNLQTGNPYDLYLVKAIYPFESKMGLRKYEFEKTLAFIESAFHRLFENARVFTADGRQTEWFEVEKMDQDDWHAFLTSTNYGVYSMLLYTTGNPVRVSCVENFGFSKSHTDTRSFKEKTDTERHTKAILRDEGFLTMESMEEFYLFGQFNVRGIGQARLEEIEQMLKRWRQ